MEQSAVVKTSTNGRAIASLVLSLTWLAGIGAVLAVIFGNQAKKEIDASNGLQTGRGMAQAGVIIGWIGIAGAVLYWGLVIIVALHGSNSSAGGY